MKFTSYRARRSVIGARRTLRDTGEDRPKVFINEDLTQKRATLLFKARTKKIGYKIVGHTMVGSSS